MLNWNAEIFQIEKKKKKVKIGGLKFGHLVFGSELFKEIKIQMQTDKTIQGD